LKEWERNEKEILKEFLEIFIGKPGIAFYTSTSSRKYYYYDYFIPLYTLGVAEEMTKEVEEVRRAEETLRGLNDAKILFQCCLWGLLV